MTKQLYITCIIFLIQSNIFAQVANATASVTIVTPVGAEISGAMAFEDIPTILSQTTMARGSGVNLIKDESCSAFLKIIAGSFIYDVVFQTDPIILKRKSGSETMRVNLLRELTMEESMDNNDIVNLPSTASIMLASSPVSGVYSSFYSVTVIFN